MIAYQLSIFAENKPGKLAAVTGVLNKEKINIRATTIATADTFGVVNLIVDDPQKAEAALAKAGMTVHLREVLAVLIPDKPGGLDALTQLLYKEKINVNNAYGFVLEGSKSAVFVVDVDQLEKTEKLLEENGFKTLDTKTLSAM
ncbi:MAG TPA: ACT domain-containing protein [Smithellaceae bacterium]|nr:ACT domain-containing protein [Smithellaceae bacterium]HRS89051.1 ACT domain-containing protein [Smithellaceae bacterium]HRV25077.1 ACT domain-containing protein [Smithellaceae bacterium]